MMRKERNIYNLPLRDILFAVLAGLFMIPAWGQKPERETNALDYVLQKPAMNEKFKKKRFGDHLFIAPEAGVTFMRGNSPFWYHSYGGRVGLTVGDWLTPVHGLRLGLNAGVHNGPGNLNPYFGGVSLDYMLNFSALGLKYEHNRIFELVGTAGLEYMYGYKFAQGKHVGGIRFGLQGKINISPMAVFYIEPRYGFYSDGLDFRTSSWKYDTQFSLMAGLGYRIVPASYRRTEPFIYHLFFSVAGGGAALLRPSSKLFSDKGAVASISIGTWFTPASGLRFTAKGTYLSKPNAPKTKDIGVQADYMLNMHALFGGYRPSRRFEIYLMAGVNYDYVKAWKEKNKTWGFGIGGQAVLHLNDNVDLFVEPRVTAYKDKTWGDINLGHMDAVGTLMAGVTYNYAPSKRYKNGVFSNNGFSDHMFMGAGVGGMILVNASQIRHPKGNIIPSVYAYVGKWFSSTSGLRLSVEAGGFKDGRPAIHKIGILGADYMWNITSCLNGYNPSRVFELIGGIGANVALTTGNTRNIFPGANISLQGLWHVSNFVGLFIEPQLHIYGNSFANGTIPVIHTDGLLSARAGINLRFNGYNKQYSRELFDKADTKSFVSIAGGFNTTVIGARSSANHGLTGQVALGRWYTPISAWRLGANSVVRRDGSKEYLYAGLSLDYMMNLSNLALQYSPHRVFDVIAFAGAGLGLNYMKGDECFVPSLDFGIQGRFNVSSHVDIFVEPKILLQGKNRTSPTRKLNPEAMLSVGLNYKIGEASSRMNGTSASLGFTPNSSVSVSIGPGAFSETTFRSSNFSKNLATSIAVAYGYRFTKISGVRFSVDYSLLPITENNLGLISLNADYMFSLATLLSGYDSKRPFDIWGMAGPSLGFVFGGDIKSGTGLGASLGLQAAWSVSENVDIFLEPSMQLWDGAIYSCSARSYAINGNLRLGASYKF
ncbi:MAG: hypothetical protein ACLSC9_02945 [Barnesiella sp.]